MGYCDSFVEERVGDDYVYRWVKGGRQIAIGSRKLSDEEVRVKNRKVIRRFRLDSHIRGCGVCVGVTPNRYCKKGSILYLRDMYGSYRVAIEKAPHFSVKG